MVHFKTNYSYRLSNHCFINELILVTYALISNAVEKKLLVSCISMPIIISHVGAASNDLCCTLIYCENKIRVTVLLGLFK